MKGEGKNPANCKILKSCVFENFVLADDLFAKDLRSLDNRVSVNNNLYRKLVSSLESPITLDKRFKVTSVQFFISDFNLLSC